jgi:hypothetical protein
MSVFYPVLVCVWCLESTREGSVKKSAYHLVSAMDGHLYCAQQVSNFIFICCYFKIKLALQLEFDPLMLSCHFKYIPRHNFLGKKYLFVIEFANFSSQWMEGPIVYVFQRSWLPLWILRLVSSLF